MKKIKALVMDVDGTLTDGKIYISSEGEIMKAFNCKDGYGITRIAEMGIIPVILTGRQSAIVEQRCKELKVTEVYQGVKNKAETLRDITEHLNCAFDELAYMGDDLNDMECFELCGLKGCPFDASNAIKEKSDYICTQKGGDGAVREFIEFIIDKHGRY